MQCNEAAGGEFSWCGQAGSRHLVAGLFLVAFSVLPAWANVPAETLHPCRVEGLPNELRCGSVMRPLDPAKPEGVMIEVHFLVVPAMARNKQPDPVLLLAGGPGQSAIALAPAVAGQFARLNNRRDVVFIDQRGTGKSAPLPCPDEKDLPLAQALDPHQQQLRIAQCREGLGKLPHGDLRFYTTTLAMQDFDAVRQALGAPRWNLVGASYGTRAALEYLRQFPDKVRRTVLDGVAPPDMVLPASFSIDTQKALDTVLAACEQEEACKHQYPRLRQEWVALLKSLPRTVSVDHPQTGLAETFVLTRDMVLRSVRTPLYSPAIASALPAAIHATAQGRYAGLVGLAGALGTSKSSRLAMGMHFSVVCAEDMPRLASHTEGAGRDFGNMDADLYARACAQWPRGAVSPAFYTVPPAQSPVLLLSGGADPATPPRHGERVQRALGAKAQHIVLPQAGHGVMGVGCMRELVSRFIDTQDDAKALPQDATCATGIPRPGAFIAAGANP